MTAVTCEKRRTLDNGCDYVWINGGEDESSDCYRWSGRSREKYGR